MKTFTLKSSDLGGQATNSQYLNGMGFTGENLSPQLYWENAPLETASFAVTIYDKDAPTLSGLWHWVIFNIPSNVSELMEGAGDVSKSHAPEESVQSNNDFGRPGYFGFCPSPGPAHQYQITVYALKSKIELPITTSAAVVGFHLESNTISKASMIVYGKR